MLHVDLCVCVCKRGGKGRVNQDDLASVLRV